VNNFYLGQTPITQAQYKAVTGTDPTDRGENSDAQMDPVNWDHADEYCEKLTTLDREGGVLSNEWEYRLPTEAERKYACRAGTLESRDGEPQDIACNHDNADGRPHPVGQKAPDTSNFHDMPGDI
jgi:formylglycine-generating enzyme required for sulfatase activity